MSALDQNRTDALEFFEQTISDQIHLTAIDPKKRRSLEARDFGTETQAALQWAVGQNATGMNVYYTVNRVRSGKATKPSKADITAVRFAHVDVDPPKGRASFTEEEKHALEARLLGTDPCSIIWSGNGVQALWRLDEGVSVDHIEQINKGLIEALGGDVGTHNVDRLLRVPGLVNWPDERKRSLGRAPTLARIRYMDESTVHAFEQMLADYPVQRTERPTQHLCSDSPMSDVKWLNADDLRLDDGD